MTFVKRHAGFDLNASYLRTARANMGMAIMRGAIMSFSAKSAVVRTGEGQTRTRDRQPLCRLPLTPDGKRERRRQHRPSNRAASPALAVRGSPVKELFVPPFVRQGQESEASQGGCKIGQV